MWLSSFYEPIKFNGGVIGSSCGVSLLLLIGGLIPKVIKFFRTYKDYKMSID